MKTCKECGMDFFGHRGDEFCQPECEDDYYYRQNQNLERCDSCTAFMSREDTVCAQCGYDYQLHEFVEVEERMR